MGEVCYVSALNKCDFEIKLMFDAFSITQMKQMQYETIIYIMSIGLMSVSRSKK